MKRIWQENTLLSNICALPIIIISGRLADRFSAKVMGPLFIILQILMSGAYYFIKEPNTAPAFILAAFFNGIASGVIVILQGYAVKRVPKMIRGITMAVMIAVASTGGIIYLQISKLFYTSAPWMIFVLIGLLDIPILIFLLVAIYCGKWGDLPEALDQDDEDSVENEPGSNINPEEIYLDDGIKDVPIGQDLHDEKIPEVASSHEATSYHKSKGNPLRESHKYVDLIEGSLRSGSIDQEPLIVTGTKSKRQSRRVDAYTASKVSSKRKSVRQSERKLSQVKDDSEIENDIYKHVDSQIDLQK